MILNKVIFVRKSILVRIILVRIIRLKETDFENVLHKKLISKLVLIRCYGL